MFVVVAAIFVQVYWRSVWGPKAYLLLYPAVFFAALIGGVIPGIVGTFSVRDEGMGIDPSVHHKVFERFERGGQSTNIRGWDSACIFRSRLPRVMAAAFSSTASLGKGQPSTSRSPRSSSPEFSETKRFGLQKIDTCRGPNGPHRER